MIDQVDCLPEGSRLIGVKCDHHRQAAYFCYRDPETEPNIDRALVEQYITVRCHTFQRSFLPDLEILAPGDRQDRLTELVRQEHGPNNWLDGFR